MPGSLGCRLVACASVFTTGLLGSTAARGVEVPTAQGALTDLAGLVDDSHRLRIEDLLTRAEASGRVQLFVLTLPTLAGDDLSEFSIRVARSWGIGGEDRDDGVLLLVVRDDRLLRLEVGYGIEETLTDLESARILDEVIVPRLRADDAGGGIEAGVAAVLRRLDIDTGPASDRAPPIGPVAKLLLSALGGAALLFVSLRVACAAGPGAWFTFPVFLLPCYAFFSLLSPSAEARPAIALVVVATALFLFVAVRVFVRHSRRGRTWSSSSRLGHVLGADAERIRGSAPDGDRADRRASRDSSWGSGGFSGGGGDFGGGGASSRW